MQNQMPAQQGDADTACIVSVVGGGVWPAWKGPHTLSAWEGLGGSQGPETPG